MQLHLEGTAGNVVGKRLTVTRDKPVIIRAKTPNHEAGRVVVEFREGTWRIDNQSHLACRLNAHEQRQAALSHGDVLEIGKDGFRVAIEGDSSVSDDHDAHDTQAVDRGAAAAAETEEADQPQCAVCDAPIPDKARPRSWNDGKRWICQRCVTKGVKPDHLPRSGATPLPGTVPVPVSLRSLASRPLDAGEPTPLTTHVLPSDHDDTDEMLPPATKAPASPAQSQSQSQSDSDRLRHSRRISASRLAAVEPAASRQGLLSKMGNVFRRDERQVRLEELERARADLLTEAGRHALGADGGMGLPEEAVSALLKGGTVTLSGGDLAAAGLERWRTQRQRMALLDAEIAALRRALGLGPDPEAHAQSSPTLRADQRVHQERAFATLDGMATDDLSKHARKAPEESDIVEEPSAAERQERHQSSTRIRPGRRHR